MLRTPFYDPLKSYEENYNQGPFGIFQDNQKIESTSKFRSSFLGAVVNLPFGIPAGPLINANFCKAAFDKGFDVLVYKTIRSGFFPCHPFPNILSVKVDGDLTYEKAQQKLVADNSYEEPLSITNSFGVPSKDPQIWQADVKKAILCAGKGQVLILSLMGTVRENQTPDEFVADWVQVAKMAKETGAKILEANLSCPNIGNEGLVCYNIEMSKRVCKAIREVIGDTPLILKVGYYVDDVQLKGLTEIVKKYAQGIAAINTIQAEIINDKGEQALPGEKRSRSGVCGTGIKWAGLEMVKKLSKIRQEIDAKYQIIGVGGVMTASDYFEYREAGADCVMSATGAMWNPYLAEEIKQKLI